MLIMHKIIAVISLCLISIETKRILGVFPVPSISHQVVFRPVMHELAKRGHEVTVITTDPAFTKDQAPENLTEIDVHDVAYSAIEKCFEKTVLDNLVEISLTCFSLVFEEEMKSAEIQSLINNKSNQFDLLFVESISRPALGFTYLYKVPVIEFSSLAGQFDFYQTHGAATHPLIYPLGVQRRIYNLTLGEKIFELYMRHHYDNVYEEKEPIDNKLIRRVFGPNVPDIKKLRQNIHMSFLNVHPMWDSNRPVPPNVIYLGGLHQKPAKKLPKDIQSYLDNSAVGVIYVSFGSNVLPSLLPPEKIKVMTRVFSQLPYDILLKWDKENLPDCPKNVKIFKWMPQSDLLRHPKVKLFITQGGLQSTDEAITAGVPLIGIPMLWDQWYNVDQYVIHKIGIRLDLETLTEANLKNAINTIIDNNQSYRENVLKLRSIIEDQPQSPLERAVWWTQYVLRHGGAKHLQSPAANMHWTEYYLLDLVLILLGTVIAVIISVVVIIKYVISTFKSKDEKIKIS